MGISGQSKEFIKMHQDACWQEMKRSKETKDKIVFFIGTLFISVLFGSSVLIYKSYEPQITEQAAPSILNKLYVVQYILMHLFFLLLYFYYTYNNIQEKIYSIELQCCQARMQTLSEDYKTIIKIPFGFLKRYYCDGRRLDGLKPRWFKDVSNGLMVLIYTAFSAIPLLFKKDFILFDDTTLSTTFKLKLSWILIWALGMIILIIIITSGNSTIKRIKKCLLKNWDIEEDNKFGI